MPTSFFFNYYFGQVVFHLHLLQSQVIYLKAKKRKFVPPSNELFHRRFIRFLRNLELLNCFSHKHILSCFMPSNPLFLYNKVMHFPDQC